MYFYGYRQHQPHAFVNKQNKTKQAILKYYAMLLYKKCVCYASMITEMTAVEMFLQIMTVL